MTHVSVYNSVEWADPYLVCDDCGGWVTGYLDKPGKLMVLPCEHTKGFTDVCPSWGPVDGCQCLAVLGHVKHGEPLAARSPSRTEREEG